MKKYKINKGIIVQKLDKKTVIFDGEKSLLFTFNETASHIFNLLKKGKTEEEISASLVKRYEITEKMAEKDLKEIITDLRKKKIIV
jgi:hypothetical protein